MQANPHMKTHNVYAVPVLANEHRLRDDDALLAQYTVLCPRLFLTQGFREKLCKYMCNGQCEIEKLKGTPCTFAHSIFTLRCPEQNAVDRARYRLAAAATLPWHLVQCELYDRACALGLCERGIPRAATELELNMANCACLLHLQYGAAFVRHLTTELMHQRPVMIGRHDVSDWMAGRLNELMQLILLTARFFRNLQHHFNA